MSNQKQQQPLQLQKETTQPKEYRLKWQGFEAGEECDPIYPSLPPSPRKKNILHLAADTRHIREPLQLHKRFAPTAASEVPALRYWSNKPQLQLKLAQRFSKLAAPSSCGGVLKNPLKVLMDSPYEGPSGPPETVIPQRQ